MSLRDYIARAVRPKLHEKFGNLLEIDISDDPALVEEIIDRDDVESGSLSGLNIIIEYEDAGGQKTQRAITCRALHVAASKNYIQAFCHHRQALRSFRLDRIVDIFDPITGESLSPVQAFFSQFSPDLVTKSDRTWGLSVAKRADLIALLNALVFVARCDREFHPAERDSLEQAITRFWLLFEIATDCHVGEILSYADRLAPDGETFWVAMHRFKEEPILASVFRRAAVSLIQSDGIIRGEETYWAIEIDDFLNDV